MKSHAWVAWAVWRRDIYCVSSLHSQIQSDVESISFGRWTGNGSCSLPSETCASSKNGTEHFSASMETRMILPSSIILTQPHKWLNYFNRESPDMTRLSLQSPSGCFLFVPPIPEDWGNCKANLYLTLKRDEAGETKVLARKNLYGTYRRVVGWTFDCWDHLSKSFPQGTISY